MTIVFKNAQSFGSACNVELKREKCNYSILVRTATEVQIRKQWSRLPLWECAIEEIPLPHFL